MLLKNVPPNSEDMARPQVPWTCESEGVTSSLLDWATGGSYTFG